MIEFGKDRRYSDIPLQYCVPKSGLAASCEDLEHLIVADITKSITEVSITPGRIYRGLGGLNPLEAL